MSPLVEALELRSKPTRLRFEAAFSTGFAFFAPANLDVVLEGHEDSERVAIESKFCEPFEGSLKGSRKEKFADAYLDETRVHDWHGLGHLLELARAQ